MATVDAAIVEGMNNSGFFGLLFRTLNFFAAFGLVDVPFAATALVSSFAFKTKATKC